MGSCAAPSAKGDDKFITTDYLQQCHNSYDQIRATLMTMIEWDEELRSRIGVMNYIHQRTRVSRSVVAEVLAALRKGNYIEMNKGKLISINRLPSEY